MEKTFFIALVLIKFSTAQIPDRTKIEAQLANVSNDLIKSEAKLVKKLSNLKLQVKYCSSNLKASNFSTNFTDVLDNMMATVQQIQTMNDYANISNISMDLISSYDYCQFRIATSFSDIKHYKAIIETIQANETRLSEYGGNVTSNYISNYKTFIKLKSKDKTVMATIRHVLITFSDFGAYIQTLTAHVGNLMRLNSYLSELIVSKEISPPPKSTVDPFMASVRDVESKLVPCQEQVLTYVKFDLMKIGIAMKTVTAGSTKQPASQKSILSSLKKSLDVIADVNDYSLVGWPQLPDLPADGKRTTLKLRSKICEDKKRNFEIFLDNAKKNQSRISEDRTALNASTASVSSARKVGLAQAMIDVVSATLKVEALYENYIKSLHLAIEEIQDLEDSLEEITTVLTTSTVPLTTSTSTSTLTTTTTPSTTTTIPTTTTTTSTVPTTTTSTTSTTTTVPTTTSTSTTTTTSTTTSTTTLPTTTTSTTSTSTTTIPTTTTSTTTMIPTLCSSTTISPTTTISASTTATSLLLCGTYVTYDPVNDPCGPAIRGVAVGMHADGTMGYAGMGLINTTGQSPTPGILTLKSPGGIYVTVVPGKNYDTVTPRYFLNHPDLAWVKTNKSQLMKVNNTLRFQSSVYRVMVGKVQYKGFWYVSKVHYDNSALGLYIREYNQTFDFPFDVNFEVLTCQPIVRKCFLPYNEISTPVYDANGVYVKSICENKLVLNFGNSDLECRKYGMFLYSIATKEEFDALKAYITGKFGVGTNVSYIISGIWSGTTWITYNPNPVPLYTGAYPTDSYSSNCLRIGGNGTHLFTERIMCGSVSIFPSICESI